jgi:hypothetical protein
MQRSNKDDNGERRMSWWLRLDVAVGVDGWWGLGCVEEDGDE